MSALIHYESSVDEATVKYLEQTETVFSSSNATCDFARWLQWYAFDVIGAITYSKRHGFIDKVKDVDGMVRYLGWLFSYVAPNPIIRILDRFDLNPFSFAVVKFAKARMSERLTAIDEAKSNGHLDSTPSVGRGDLLSMFLKAKEASPTFFHDGRVLTLAVSMAFAGSETTGISLAAVFYYLIKNPKKYCRLVQEIDDAAGLGLIEERPSGLISWAESQKLPYLDACIKEAFRLHPATGLLLERVVPPHGAEICSEYIPGGTIVGCNAWVIHRRPEVFGEDVDVYRPERWLEVFLADPGQEWKLHNAWFVRQLNFDVTFKIRDRSVSKTDGDKYET
ncbi:MAG: hypothetical protein Q9215_003289 [Flavoplaca cf. flavocitrina]